jgi:hypothetical protein
MKTVAACLFLHLCVTVYLLLCELDLFALQTCSFRGENLLASLVGQHELVDSVVLARMAWYPVLFGFGFTCLSIQRKLELDVMWIGMLLQAMGARRGI